MIVTTSTFTKAARAEAQDRHLRPVALIGGELLTEKLIEHEIGIRKKGRRFWSLPSSRSTPSPLPPHRCQAA